MKTIRNNRNESQVLLIVLLVLGIIGIIVFSLSARVIRTMKETTEKRLSNASFSEAQAALDTVYEVAVNYDINEYSDCEEDTINDVLRCTIQANQTDSSLRCDDSIVVVSMQNSIPETLVEKDGVLEVNVKNFTGNISISYTYTGSPAPVLIVKSIGKSGGKFSVLKEELITASGSVFSVPLSSEIVRIRPLKNDVLITVTGSSLPDQQRAYTVTSTCGVGTPSAVTTKLVRVEWLYPGVPPAFDFVLYNGGGELKKY